jgi:regulatory protein
MLQTALRDSAAARAKTELLIKVRDRSTKELADRLRQAGFPEQIARAEVARAVRAGLVDDERFCRLYVSGKAHLGWGRNRITREIRRYGIDLSQKEGYPEAFFSEEDELERARLCLRSFHTRSKNPQAACLRRLVNKGFSLSIARQALSELTVLSEWNTM